MASLIKPDNSLLLAQTGNCTAVNAIVGLQPLTLHQGWKKKTSRCDTHIWSDTVQLFYNNLDLYNMKYSQIQRNFQKAKTTTCHRL